MNHQVIVNLENFLITDFIAIELAGFVFTDNYTIREAYYDKLTQQAVGLVNSRHSREAAFVWYEKRIELQDSELFDIDLNDPISTNTDKVIDNLKCYFNFLWLVRDNSIGITNILTKITGTTKASFMIDSYSTSNSKGERVDVRFTLEDLKLANELYVKYNTILNDSIKKMPTDLKIKEGRDVSIIYKSENEGIVRTRGRSYNNEFNYKNTNCLERAFHFLGIARGEDYLIYKIAFYIPILECLFATEHGEITTQIAYRTAFYLGGDTARKLEVDRIVRRTYNIRSRFIHGQPFNGDSKEPKTTLIYYSTELDKIIREVLIKIILNDSAVFLAEKEIKESFLNSLVFNQINLPPTLLSNSDL